MQQQQQGQPPVRQGQQQSQPRYQNSRPAALPSSAGGIPGIKSPGGNVHQSPPSSSRASTASAGSNPSSLSPAAAVTVEQLSAMVNKVSVDEDARSETSANSSQLEARVRALYAPNPQPGTLGNDLNVISNMYRTFITVPTMCVYAVECYDADGVIKEKLGPYRKSLYFALKHKLVASIGLTFWDNTTLRAFLGKTGDVFAVDNLNDLNARWPRGRMELTCTRVDDLSNPELAYEVRHQYIHIMLKQLAMDANLARLGRSYLQHQIFSGTQTYQQLVQYQSLGTEDHLEVHRGYQLSIENVIRNLFMLKTDIVHHLVSQQSCDMIFNRAYKAAGERFARDEERAEEAYRRMVEAELVGCIVLTRYNPRLRYRVDRIDWYMTADSTFEDDKDQTVSFRDYVKHKWKFDSKFWFNGLIVSKQKFRTKDGNKKEHDIFLIPDACHRTGLTGKMKDDFRLKKRVSEATTVAPRDRTGITDRVVASLNAAGARQQRGGRAESKDNTFRVPMSFECKAERVTAKVLPSPMLRVMSQGAAKKITANSKGFSRDVEESCFVTRMTTRVKSWAIVYPQERGMDEGAHNLFTRIEAGWRRYGTALPRPQMVPVDVQNRDRALPNWKAALDHVMKGAPQMVVVVLPRNGDSYYHLTSERGTFHGIVTQCMKSQQLGSKRFGQVVTGMVRQMKAKNCSNPWLVEMPLKGHPRMLNPGSKGPLDTMLVGMDVNHDRKNDTSTVGFCSTYGDTANYFSQHSFQAFQKESITEAKALMLQALLFYKKKAGRFPKNVVIFRDGVSDSQFDMVLNRELLKYRAAASEAAQREQQRYTPKFTLVVTQKRVSVRFTTADKRSVPAGTVIDTGVIADGVWNFYLHPCAANLQGHVVPTRFVVLIDEVGFSQNDMQTLCHNLCYAYPNWAGPIRVPCPAMMAHGVAFKFGSGRAALLNYRSHNGVIQAINPDNPKLAGKNHCL